MEECGGGSGLVRGAYALIAVAVVASGCGLPPPEVSARQSDVCGVKQDGTPLAASELVAKANTLRDGALTEQAAGGLYSVEVDLIRASDCYSRALVLNPDGYDANLGLGVTLIAHARLLLSYNRAPYLLGAKRALGRAYMVRQGAYDPIYYLAEAAVLAENWDQASEFLDALAKAKARLGPVYALYGYIAEKRGLQKEGERYYKLALEVGSSGATLEFVSSRLAGR
jgi:tetratricopeptide (TPR) repeat protein